jgi:hypothetical protein
MILYPPLVDSIVPAFTIIDKDINGMGRIADKIKINFTHNGAVGFN